MNSKDLRCYLFEDTVKNLEDLGYPEFGAHLKESIKRHSRFRNLLKISCDVIKIFHSLQTNLYNQKKDFSNVVVHQSLHKYPIIIKILSDYYNLYFIGPDLFSLGAAMKNKTGYISVDDVYKNLNDGIIYHDDNLLKKSLNDLKAILIAKNPRFIFLDNDHLPESRLIVRAAKELRIPTIEIQHGIYQSIEPLITGKFVDYVFVWGKFFKNLYLNQKIREEESIKILGYPYSLNTEKNLINRRKVVYLGQNFELHNNNLLNVKINTITSLNTICNKLGLEFTYRPHPFDDVKILKQYLPHIKFCNKSEKLKTSFYNNDIFISFNSTALIEAVLNFKIGLQLKNYPIPTDDFEKIGVCPSFENMGEIESYLKKLSKIKNLIDFHTHIDENYIMIPNRNLGNKLLMFLDDLDV